MSDVAVRPVADFPVSEVAVHVADDGVEIPYEVIGDGPKRMVFAHSLTAVGIGLAPLITPILDLGFTVVSYDQRGHGRATPVTDPEGYAVERFGTDMLGLLDAVGWESAWLAGGSLGAAVAIDAAAQRPDRAEGLGLIAPAFGREPVPAFQQWGPVAAAFDDGLAAGSAYWEEHFRATGLDEVALANQVAQLQNHKAEALAVGLRVIPTWSLGPQIEALATFPRTVAVVAWADDELHSMDVAEDLVATAPQGKLWPMKLEDMAVHGPLLLFAMLAELIA